jgi:hypothetical protein
MNTTIARSFTRYFAVPIVSAGIIGGAAIGLAGAANASTVTQPNPRPGIVATPNIHSEPVTRFPSKRTERLVIQDRIWHR